MSRSATSISRLVIDQSMIFSILGACELTAGIRKRNISYGTIVVYGTNSLDNTNLKPNAAHPTTVYHQCTKGWPNEKSSRGYKEPSTEALRMWKGGKHAWPDLTKAPEVTERKKTHFQTQVEEK